MLMSGCVDSASAAICVATATSKFSDRIQIGKLETGITKEIMDEKGELELRIKMNRAGVSSNQFVTVTGADSIAGLIPQDENCNCHASARYCELPFTSTLPSTKCSRNAMGGPC